MGTGQQVHERREEDDAELAVPVRRLVHAEAARGHHEVGFVVHERLQHLRQLGRIVLAVGVEGDHVLRAQGLTHRS